MLVSFVLALAIQAPAPSSPADMELALLRDANALRDLTEDFIAFLKERGRPGRQPGIGVYFSSGIDPTTQKPRPVTILGIFPDSPAAKAQIRPGDQLLTVDGTSPSGMLDHEVVGLHQNGITVSWNIRKRSGAEQTVLITPRPLACIQEASDLVDFDKPHRTAAKILELVDPILSELARPGVEPELFIPMHENISKLRLLLRQTMDLLRHQMTRVQTGTCGVIFND